MSRIVLQKINNYKVKPPKEKKKNDIPVAGDQLFSEPYPNIGIIAKKKSGKTVVIFNIIKEKAGPETQIIDFCSTAGTDQNHIAIREWCQKKHIVYNSFSSLIDTSTGKKVDILAALTKQILSESEKELDEEEEFEPEEVELFEDGNLRPDRYGGRDQFGRPVRNELEDYEEDEDEDPFFGRESKSQNPAPAKMFGKRYSSALVLPKKKEKLIYPKWIFIFDDLSTEIKTPSMAGLLKKNRHLKCMTIVSSQYLCDLKPESLQNLDYCLVFKGIDKKKLEKLYYDAGISTVPFSSFQNMYNNATRNPFSFFYIDVKEESFRKNFDEMYKATSE